MALSGRCYVCEDCLSSPILNSFWHDCRKKNLSILVRANKVGKAVKFQGAQWPWKGADRPARDQLSSELVQVFHLESGGARAAAGQEVSHQHKCTSPHDAEGRERGAAQLDRQDWARSRDHEEDEEAWRDQLIWSEDGDFEELFSDRT